MYQKLLQRLSRITFRNFYEIQDVQTIQENIEEVLKAKKLIRQSGLRFITSDESSYVTGQIVNVDGGLNSHVPTVAQFRQLNSRTW